MQFGVGFDGDTETFQIFVSELVGDSQHAGFDFFDLREADLMNLFRR
jgi:hypothetical protein